MRADELRTLIMLGGATHAHQQQRLVLKYARLCVHQRVRRSGGAPCRQSNVTRDSLVQQCPFDCLVQVIRRLHEAV